MADSGKWRELKAIVDKQFAGKASVTSAYRPGSKGSSGGADLHSSGDAVDIAPPSMEIFNWLAANYPDSDEIIYTPAGNRQIKNGAPHLYSAGVAAGHYDHVHWGRKSGGGGATGASASGAGGGSSDSSFTGLGSFISFFSNTGMWSRVGVAIGGLVLLLFAIAKLTGMSQLSPTSVAKKATSTLKAVNK